MGKTLDKFDVQLLNLLQANTLATAEALARDVPLSPSAITRRLRHLRGSGLIAADVAVLSPALTRHRLRAVVHVQLREHAEERGVAAIRTRLIDAPEIQLCLEISGEFDLMLLVSVRDMMAFNAFADEMLAADACVRRFETTFVKKSIKDTAAIWLKQNDMISRG